MPITILHFPEAVPDGTMRLDAVVLWRGAPGDPLPEPRGPLAWLRRLRHRLWLHFGPLGIDLHVRWPRPGRFSGELRRDDGGSISSASLPWHREPVVHVEHGPGRLRLLGRVYRLPRDGRTLVLMVVPRGRRAPRVTVRRVVTPALPMPPMPPMPPGYLESGFDPANAEVSIIMGGDEPAWTEALRADRAVRAFLD